MSIISPAATPDSAWVRFWHAPVRAERLAVTRIAIATALLGDQLVHYLPNIAEFYGPHGIAPYGLHDASQLEQWRWTILLIPTDNVSIIYCLFGVWVAVTILFLVGWQTRLMNVLCFVFTRSFAERCPYLVYGADNVLAAALVLLMLSPCGAALSVDAWLKRRRGLLVGPVTVPPWSLRLLQIQLCLIYCTTGVAKLWTLGSWWKGTAVWFFLQDVDRSRHSLAQIPIPFWMTKVMTYVSVWWELLFPLLVANRWTRNITLIIGILFHIGVSLTADIAWFGFYSVALYGVWISDSFWERFDAKPASVDVAGVSVPAQTRIIGKRRSRITKKSS